MATIRDTYVLDVKTDRAVNNLKSITTQNATSSKSFSGLKTAVVAASGALATLGAINLAKNAVETFTAYENLTTQIATYTGGLDNARKELSRLEDLSVKLPQDLNDLAQAFTVLKRTGIDTTNESIQALSEIAAANGKSMTQLAEAVADGMTGEFERFKEFGIKVSKEGDQMVARIGDQQVAVSESATDLINQLVALGEEGGRFFGAAAANSETLNQSFSNLKGAISIVERSFVEGLKPGLQGVTEGFTELLTNNKDLIKDFGTLIGEALSKLPGLFSAVMEIVEPLAPLFRILGTVATEVVLPGLQAVATVVGTLAGAIEPVVNSLLPAFKAGFSGVAEIAKTVKDVFMAIVNTVKDMINLISGEFSDMVDGAVEKAKSLRDGVLGWFDDTKDEAVDNSIIPDMVDDILREFDRLNIGMNGSLKRGTADNLGLLRSIADEITKGLGVGNIFDPLIDSVIGARTPSFVGGGFPLVGDTPSQIINQPTDRAPYQGTTVQMNINAVDAPSFRNLVARDPQFIASVAQKGLRTIPFRR